MSDHNEGVIISGHAQLKSEVLAVGSNARAVKIVKGNPGNVSAKDCEELRSRIEELTAVLASHKGPLEHRAQVESSVKAVKDELGKDEPNKLTVTSLLTGIAGAVSSVTGIATAAEALKAVVMRLF